MVSRDSKWITWLVVAAACLSWAGASSLLVASPVVFGQELELNLLNQIGQPPVFGADDPVKAEASYQLQADTAVPGKRRGRLQVKVTVQPGWHVYSVTQPPGGPLPTTFQLDEGTPITIDGPFTPDVAPKIKQEDAFPGVNVEEHSGTITWTAPISFATGTLAEGADPQDLLLGLTVSGLTCQVSCIPFDVSVKASYAGMYEPVVASTTPFRQGEAHTTWLARVQTESGKYQLQFTAEPDPNWHVYAYAATDPNRVAKPTLLVINAPQGWQVGKVQPSAEPHAEESGVPEDPILYYYEEPVTWSVQLTPPADLKPGSYAFSGLIGYQSCTSSSCDPDTALKYAIQVDVSDRAAAGPFFASFEESTYKAAAQAAAAAEAKAAVANDAQPSAAEGAGGLDLDNLEGVSEKMPLYRALGLALLGGFILNFMPCVLPVIGLKVMSFVQQAGENNRKRVFLLNLWYSLGLLSVFIALAVALVVFNLGWGQQSQSPIFTVTLSAIIFVMGLSFIGVWEIPIPGFVGSSKTAEYSERGEGHLAAFLKGIITTIVAVPCSGPALASALAWCAGKPTYLVFVVFLFMGIGMALPYVIIGINPKLVAFLPKPGLWMETFKQFLGFCLIGTVVFFLSYLPSQLVLPTIAFLFGLWMACWLIGSISITASASKKWSMRALAALTGVGIGIVSFGMPQSAGVGGLAKIMADREQRALEQRITELAEDGQLTIAMIEQEEVNENELPWEIFTEQRLLDETAKGNTVLVDFTADW